MVAPHLLLLFSSFLLCAFSSWVCHVSVWRSILHGFDQGDPGRTLRAERDAHAFAHFHESRLFLHIPSFIPCNTHPFIVRVYRCDVMNVFSQVHAKKFGSISDIKFMFYTYIYIYVNIYIQYTINGAASATANSPRRGTQQLKPTGPATKSLALPSSSYGKFAVPKH